MSQYAYIPLGSLAEVKRNYTVIGPHDWQFEKDGEQYGGMEEVVFTPAQIEEIESLGGEWFESSEAFRQWMEGASAEAQKRRDIRFGESLLLEFFTATKDVSLDNETYRAVSETFKYAEVALRRGDIPQAKTELTAIEPADPIWTQDAKDYFIAKINAYLG